MRVPSPSLLPVGTVPNDPHIATVQNAPSVHASPRNRLVLPRVRATVDIALDVDGLLVQGMGQDSRCPWGRCEMSDYTLTTENIRDEYSDGWEYRREMFDIWLAAHDAEVYRRAREDAAKAVEALGSLRCYEVYEADDGYLAGSYYEVDAIAAARGDVA